MLNINFLFAVFLVLSLAVTTIGQVENNCFTPPKKDSKTERIAGDCGDWKKFVLRGLSMCVPTDFNIANHPSIDGEGLRYENDTLRFSIDTHWDQFRPTVERRLPSYTEQTFERGAVTFWRWKTENRLGRKYTLGVNVWDVKAKRYLAGIYLQTDSSDAATLGSGIFDSICYETKKIP